MKSAGLVAMFALVAGTSGSPAAIQSEEKGEDWTALAEGVGYRTFIIDPDGGVVGRVHVVRIDTSLAPLTLGLASQDGRGQRTARQWCSDLDAVAVINAGMFRADGVTNVGRLVHGDHVNQPAWNGYKSALVFGPRHPHLASARLLDLDIPAARDVSLSYIATVQNLRLIKAPGHGVWSPNRRAWSEAAVAQDKDGRIVFLFTREGYEMATWTRHILALPLHVVAAMHVEGGPEASLSVCSLKPPLHLSGSFETGFNPNNDNVVQWRIPNVLAVLRSR